MTDRYVVGEDYSYVTAWGKMDMLYAIDHAYKQGYEIDFDSPYTGTIGMSQIKVMLKPKDDLREKKIRAILLNVLREKIPDLDGRSCKTVDNCLTKFEEIENAKAKDEPSGQDHVQTDSDDASSEADDSSDT